jgi:hypothetical protein
VCVCKGMRELRVCKYLINQRDRPVVDQSKRSSQRGEFLSEHHLFCS